MAYNQPPHPGFYIGPQMFPPPVPQISSADLVWRGGGANAWNEGVTANWFTNGLWVSNNTPVVFTTGKSVLFDLSGSNNSAIALSGTLTPSQVTVHSAKDFSFTGAGQLSGAMKLVKAGPARLTINNTNTYSGGTFVSGGALFVNGSLEGSPVTVERRGTPEGPAQFGGTGRLGQGLTVEAGCTLIVGANTNSAGTLTVSNNLTELGSVLNRFDLSRDPTGLTNANDRVDVFGNLLLSGTNTIEINQFGGALGGGVYPLFQYTGALIGGLTNLILSGSFIQPVALTNPLGMIGLLTVLPAAPPTAPGGLAATPIGAFQINLLWTDHSTNETAFLLERSTNNVAFTQIALLNPGATNYADIPPASGTTYYYRVRGTNLAGASDYSNTASATTPATPPTLTWRGDGSANAWDVGASPNWFDGASLGAYGDGVDVIFDQSGSNNVSVNLTGVLRPDSVTFSASKSYTFSGSGSLAGAMALVKSGSGGLTINTSNAFTGGVTVNSGTLTLGNTAGAGSGPVRFNGGTVSFVVGSQPAYANPLQVLANSILTSAGGNNNIVSGAWTGTNSTLNIGISSSGTFTIAGNMANFFGTVALGNSGGFLRFNGSSGGPNAIFDLGTGTSTLNNRNGVTITLGALSGGSGTFLSGAGAVDAPSTYLVGGRNLNTTFNGTIRDATAQRTTTINKIGTGIWTLTGANTYTGPTTVTDGTLLVNGNQSAATGHVTVAAAGTLGGVGTVGGATTISGKLAPGVSIGTLTFNNDLTLAPGSTSIFELSRVPFANDVARALGNVAYGGTLTILNISPEFLEAGDNFQLFDAPGYSGAFSAMNLPPLEDGLAWNTSRLAVDGRVWIVSTTPPTIAAAGVSGGNFILNGSGGTPGWDYYALTTTNVALPLSNWSRVATNQFNAVGGFAFTNALDPNQPKRFYRLQSR